MWISERYKLTKVLGRVIEKKVRDMVNLDGIQFGFRTLRGSTDDIFVL